MFYPEQEGRHRHYLVQTSYGSFPVLQDMWSDTVDKDGEKDDGNGEAMEWRRVGQE